MVRFMKISGGKLIEAEAGDAQVLVYVNPSEAERKQLVEVDHLDEHTVASALDPDELSRLEFEPDHMALIFKRPKSYRAADNFLFRVESVGLFLFADRMTVILAEDAPIFEGRPFTRIGSLHDLMLKIIYRSIYHFMEHLRVINNVSNELEQEVNRSMENKHLFNLFALEKSLVYYLNAVNANGKVVERIRNSAAKISLSAESLEMLDDILIENGQCYEQAMIYSNILASLMDARASIVNNNLNMLIKKLTNITIGIMAATLVVSVFSMNVPLPFPRPESGETWAFWTIMGLSAATITVVVAFWRYKKW
jgi:magnesium transporter